MLKNLIVIGEAAGHISTGLKARYASIPWTRIVAFRNIAVHEYFAVKWDMVWIAATEDTPTLRRDVAEVVELEYHEQ